MREILFRGKDIHEKWHCGLLAHIGNAWYISNKAGIPTAFEVIPSTIGQYTGLTSENGTKIFEGDIVKYINDESLKGKIVMEAGAFGIATKEEISVIFESSCHNDNFVSLWEMIWNSDDINSTCIDVEVIGNIYDNPELLEVEE